MAVRAVCFDIGGVVARISYRWAEMLRRNGLPVPAHISDDDEIHAMPRFNDYQAGLIGDDDYLIYLGEYLGGLSIEQARQVHCSMLIEPFDGVEEIVRELNETEVITGCLSNTNAPHWEELAITGRFPAIVAMRIKLASFAIDAAKPDPKAFRSFEEAAGCRPAEIILFDDSAANCDAAAALGWHALCIDPPAGPARQIREYLRARQLLTEHQTAPSV